MANPHPVPNPNIAELGKATRLGTERMKGIAKAWSIRNQVRYLAAQNIRADDPDLLKKLYGENPTIAQQAAVKSFANAFADTDPKAFEFLDERIDGKLPTTQINAEWDRIRNMDNEQLRQGLSDILDEIEDAVTKPELDAGSGGTATGSFCPPDSGARQDQSGANSGESSSDMGAISGTADGRAE